MDEKKRPGVFASDDERALASRRDRSRTPAQGVPIHTPAPEDFTPVGDVMPLAHDEATRILLARVWQHTANMEMRMLAALGQTENGRLRADLDATTARIDEHLVDVCEAIADIHGKSGTNGKLGELRRRVDAWTSKMWWLVTVLVGALGTAAVKLVLVTRAFDAVEAKSTYAEQQVKVLQAQVMTLQAAVISRSVLDGRVPGPSLVPATEPGKD